MADKILKEISDKLLQITSYESTIRTCHDSIYTLGREIAALAENLPRVYGKCIKQYNTSKDNYHDSEPFSIMVGEIIEFNRYYSQYKDATLSLDDGDYSCYVPCDPTYFELFESSEYVETNYRK